MIDPRKSKCWTCKHGICMHEAQIEHIVHNGMFDMEGEEIDTEPQEDDDPYNLFSRESTFDPSEPRDHEVAFERVKAICFWRPEIVKEAPPIVVADVKECSRYEAR